MSTASYFGSRPRSARMAFNDGRVEPREPAELDALLAVIGDAELPPVVETAAAPFVGITTDGTPIPGLFPISDDDLDSGPIVKAADAYLAGLPADLRSRAVAAVDGPEWQLWINAFLTFPEHGLLLDALSPQLRQAAMEVVAATLSSTGFETVRSAMRLNQALGELCSGYEDTLREWKYWFTVFGTPSADEPWGWQLMGHHLDVNCFIAGRQVVLTPSFVGTEFEGHTLFAEHVDRGSRLMDSLTPSQRSTTVLHPSMRSADLPHHLGGAVDGRHRAGAGRDNVVLPYEGIRGADLSATQRQLLVELTEPYISLLPAGPFEAKAAQVRRHLDDTWFSWIGDWGAGQPFYYKIHSPVILVEYDNHSGIFLDNPEPEPFHVHTIVRTPNGGDYGKNLLRDHYAAFH